MKAGFSVLFLLLAPFAFSQYNSEFLNFERTGRSISVNGEYELGSNGIYNSFFNKFIVGGHIDKKLKDASAKNMKGLNVLGANVNYNICAFFGNKPKYSYLIGFKDQQIFNSSFTKDFYELAFYGNTPYLDQTKNFSGSSINSLRFQELKIGFIWHKIDTTAKIGASVSILKGQQLFYIRANQGSSLYTNADGTELLFNSNFDMAMSDTNSNSNPFLYYGIGASADIFFETPYKSRLGKGSVLTVNANNIGFLHWFDNSVQYNSDSTFSFSGYNVDNLLDLQDSTLAAVDRDTILKNTTNARKESFNVNIPTNLLIINKILFTDKFSLSTGFRYLFNSNFKPYFFMDAEYQLAKNFYGIMHVGYGGYAKLGVGLTFIYNSPGFYVKVGSNSLQGYLSPKNTYGQGAFISIAKKFKH